MREFYPMTLSGVHINKTAVAIIIGLLVIIVLGFKYRKGGDQVDFVDRDSGPQFQNQEKQDEKKKPVKVETKQETQIDHPKTMTEMLPAWQTLDLDTVTIPEKIMKIAKTKTIEEKSYKIMVSAI